MSATAAAPSAVPACRPVKRGFGMLRCILCGEDAPIQIDLDDLETCTCRECGDEFKLADVREVLAAWQKAVAWIDSCPGRS